MIKVEIRSIDMMNSTHDDRERFVEGIQENLNAGWDVQWLQSSGITRPSGYPKEKIMSVVLTAVLTKGVKSEGTKEPPICGRSLRFAIKPRVQGICEDHWRKEMDNGKVG